MIKVALLTFFSTLLLWGEQDSVLKKVPVEGLLLWSMLYLSLIGLLFWFLYKAIKTKNNNYAYGILLAVLLMMLMLFL